MRCQLDVARQPQHPSTPWTRSHRCSCSIGPRYRSRLSRSATDTRPYRHKRGIHFGTVTSPNVGQRPNFAPESSLLWESSTLTVAWSALRPTTVPKWIPLSAHMGGVAGRSRAAGALTQRSGCDAVGCAWSGLWGVLDLLSLARRGGWWDDEVRLISCEVW